MDFAAEGVSVEVVWVEVEPNNTVIGLLHDLPSLLDSL